MADRCFRPDLPEGGPLTLEGEEAHHLARVRRAAPGDVVEVFDGRGRSVVARVVATGRDRVELEIVGPAPARRPAPVRLTLASAVPKGDRFDWLVEKATELGVARLVPILTARSVVDPRSSKLDRLRRTVIEACKQSGRNDLMAIDPVTPWGELVGLPESQLGRRWLAHPEGPEVDAAPAGSPGAGAACLAIGPEGGFDPAEVEAASALGWARLSLGPNLLRVETAALAGSCRLLFGPRSQEGGGA